MTTTDCADRADSTNTITKVVPLPIMKSGACGLWEWGGGMTNTGQAAIVAGPGGERLQPLYVCRPDSLPCGQQALLPVEVGCLVIEASHHQYDYTIQVWSVERLDAKECIDPNEEQPKAVLALLTECRGGKWWPIAPSGALVWAVEAAKAKAADYHCRTAVYVDA